MNGKHTGDEKGEKKARADIEEREKVNQTARDHRVCFLQEGENHGAECVCVCVRETEWEWEKAKHGPEA